MIFGYSLSCSGLLLCVVSLLVMVIDTVGNRYPGRSYSLNELYPILLLVIGFVMSLLGAFLVWNNRNRLR